MILGYSVYEIICLFFVYAFLGWCVEVVYRGLEEGHFINSGFLNGPVCPIYGVGGVLVVICLTPLEHNVFALFIGSALLTSLLELITGFALDKMFHTKWWDYSDLPFNIGGYICLKFSVLWGLVCVALIKGLHPVVLRVINFVPQTLGVILLIIFSMVFISDVIITVITINHLTKRMKLMDELAGKIHSVSDKIGEHVYEGAAAIRDKGIEVYNSENAVEIRERYADNVEEIKQKREEMKQRHEKEVAELKERYAALIKQHNPLQSRIVKAFPRMKTHKYNEQLEQLKSRLKKK